MTKPPKPEIPKAPELSPEQREKWIDIQQTKRVLKGLKKQRDKIKNSLKSIQDTCSHVFGLHGSYKWDRFSKKWEFDGGAICAICEYSRATEGHFCQTSPDYVCVYEHPADEDEGEESYYDDDHCIYCGQPSERK